MVAAHSHGEQMGRGTLPRYKSATLVLMEGHRGSTASTPPHYVDA